MRVIIMENKNCAILFHAFVYKTKYPVHIIIYVVVPGEDINGSYGDKKD
jgi:hypothetical protein